MIHPQTVVVSGASGMIGSALVTRLRAKGHTVRRLVRARRDAQPGDIPWQPDAGVLDASALEGADAVVHLAGAPIARRWTSARKREIRDSRLRSTSLLVGAIASLSAKPRVMLSGSAVGYYGNRGDEPLDERSAPGSDFLALVSRDWEAAAGPVADVGVRLVLLRTGIVLSPRGGALEKLLLPFRLALGGPIAGGRQWMSWISLSDHVSAMEHALFADTVAGPANLVAPAPVTNAEFTRTLARVLVRPAVLPIPRFAMKLLFGEMGEATVLASQRCAPDTLLGSGFSFADSTLEAALRRELAG